MSKDPISKENLSAVQAIAGRLQEKQNSSFSLRFRIPTPLAWKELQEKELQLQNEIIDKCAKEIPEKESANKILIEANDTAKKNLETKESDLKQLELKKANKTLPRELNEPQTGMIMQLANDVVAGVSTFVTDLFQGDIEELIKTTKKEVSSLKRDIDQTQREINFNKRAIRKSEIVKNECLENNKLATDSLLLEIDAKFINQVIKDVFLGDKVMSKQEQAAYMQVKFKEKLQALAREFNKGVTKEITQLTHKVDRLTTQAGSTKQEAQTITDPLEKTIAENKFKNLTRQLIHVEQELKDLRNTISKPESNLKIALESSRLKKGMEFLLDVALVDAASMEHYFGEDALMKQPEVYVFKAKGEDASTQSLGSEVATTASLVGSKSILALSKSGSGQKPKHTPLHSRRITDANKSSIRQR